MKSALLFLTFFQFNFLLAMQQQVPTWRTGDGKSDLNSSSNNNNNSNAPLVQDYSSLPATQTIPDTNLRFSHERYDKRERRKSRVDLGAARKTKSAENVYRTAQLEDVFVKDLEKCGKKHSFQVFKDYFELNREREKETREQHEKILQELCDHVESLQASFDMVVAQNLEIMKMIKEQQAKS